VSKRFQVLPSRSSVVSIRVAGGGHGSGLDDGRPGLAADRTLSKLGLATFGGRWIAKLIGSLAFELVVGGQEAIKAYEQNRRCRP